MSETSAHQLSWKEDKTSCDMPKRKDPVVQFAGVPVRLLVCDDLGIVKGMAKALLEPDVHSDADVKCCNRATYRRCPGTRCSPLRGRTSGQFLVSPRSQCGCIFSLTKSHTMIDTPLCSPGEHQIEHRMQQAVSQCQRPHHRPKVQGLQDLFWQP